MKNPKTTVAGYAILLGSVAYAVAAYLKTGTLDLETFKSVLGALSGTGLIMSQDGGH